MSLLRRANTQHMLKKPAAKALKAKRAAAKQTEVVDSHMVKIGTDFSGLDGPVFALGMMGIPHVHEFSCDSDEHAEDFIRTNCRPKHYWKDVRRRNRHIDRMPAVDLYVLGSLSGVDHLSLIHI